MANNQRWDGTAWTNLTTFKRWDGTAWQTCVGKRWDGTAWQTFTIQFFAPSGSFSGTTVTTRQFTATLNASQNSVTEFKIERADPNGTGGYTTTLIQDWINQSPITVQVGVGSSVTATIIVHQRLYGVEDSNVYYFDNNGTRVSGL